MENIKNLIEIYAAEVAAAYNSRPDNGALVWSCRVEYGKKFAKVIRNDYGQESVHCFIEIENGNIHKAATHKAPQKNGLRGNVQNLKKPLLSGDFYVKYR